MKTASRLQKVCSRIIGLTLVEILVALAVVGVIMAVAAPSIADLIDRRRVMAVSSEIAGVLNYAKAELANTKEDLRIRFDLDNREIAAAEKVSCVQVATQPSGTGTDCRCWDAISKKCLSNDGQNGGRMLRTFVNLNSSGVSFAPDKEDANVASMYDFSLSFNQYGYAGPSDLRVKVKGRRTELQVEMNQGGRIRICSPGNNVAGYGACN